MSRIFKEGHIRPRPEFKVRTSGMEIVHKWLMQQAEVVDNPLLAPEPGTNMGLELGGVDFSSEDEIKAIRSGLKLSLDDGIYEMFSAFITSVNSPQEALANILDSRKRKEEYGAEMSVIIEPLARKLGAKGFVVKPDFNEGVVRIAKLPQNRVQDDGNGVNGDEEWVLHENNNAELSMWCLHTNADLHESLQDFIQRVESQGKLIEEIVEITSELTRTSVPDTEYLLAPPKGIERKMQRAELLLSARKKQLGLMGLGDDGLAEEVREKMILKERPNIGFGDIGGLEEAKEELSTVVEAIRDPDSFKAWGTKPPRGVLLYGLPGTGKTLLAKALAHEANATIYVVRLADVIHHLYGKEQRIINEVFNQAEANGPSIIFIDELDALASHRGSSDQITSQIVSVLLTRMDGLQERGSGTVVVAATNRQETIDSALIRPGRLDLLIEVPLPKGPVISEIFQIHQRHANEISGRELFDITPQGYFDLIQEVERNGFSGADIEELIRRALNKKVKQQRSAPDFLSPITAKDLLSEIKAYESIRRIRAGSKIGFNRE